MIVLRTAAGVGFWLVGGALLAFATALASRPLGWFWLAVLLAVAPAQLALALWGRHRPRSAVVSVVTAATGAAVAALVAAFSPVGTDQLTDVVERIVIPETWDLRAGERSGSALCLEACPTVARTYRTPDGVCPAATVLAQGLRGQGFRVVVRTNRRQCDEPIVVQALSGKVVATAQVVPAGHDGAGAQVTLEVTSRPPAA